MTSYCKFSLSICEVNIFLDALDKEVIVIMYNQLAEYLNEAEKV